MQKDTKEYNGYANWATWDFQVITNNDYNLYHHIRNVVISNSNDKEKIIQCLRRVASDSVNDVDYYNVNFNEVADTWISDIVGE
jgi:hypothetical protein